MVYDVIIIGAGPAGLTAGIYTARSGLKTLLLEGKMPGGQAASTEKIENYPGFPEGIGGVELAMNMLQQAQRFGAELRMEEVKAVDLTGEIKTITTRDKKYEGRAVILATGSQAKKLKIKGEVELQGRGVSYCATCDGAFFKDMTVVVVGGGDAAVEEAMFLTKFAQKVYLIHRRDQFRAAKVIQDRAFNSEKVEIIWDSTVEEILGQKQVEGIIIKNIKNQKISKLACQGVFVFVGMEPNNTYLDNLADNSILTTQGYIEANGKMETAIPGVFAAGDLREKQLRQVATAVGDGAIAGVQVEKYLSHQ